MTGLEYVLSEVMEPHLFVMRKQKRTNAEKSDALLAYYILDGSIYQAPLLGSVFASRIVKLQSLLFFFFFRNSAVRFYSSLTDNDGNVSYILQNYEFCRGNFILVVQRRKFFIGLRLRYAVGMESIGEAETEADAAASESKAQKETIDLKELKRVDHILMSLQRKLPPAPPPPPFPDGYVPSEQEKGPDDLLASEPLPPAIDPIIDQGPAKRPRFQ
ncbi:Mediator of RNA polymerase II transcription subunit 6 [Triticum urartu]|uniref:Mediator of RNA polymerase II transcription subunit 6 n=1 Tax=Triticum urartu TaxID=4572 RepID=M8AQC0_TRIUA|nr:Mediator of RNA polymerase II transcription subunit 6 [Triticum urartu]